MSRSRMLRYSLPLVRHQTKTFAQKFSFEFRKLFRESAHLNNITICEGLTPNWLVEHVLIKNEFTGHSYKLVSNHSVLNSPDTATS